MIEYNKYSIENHYKREKYRIDLIFYICLYIDSLYQYQKIDISLWQYRKC